MDADGINADGVNADGIDGINADMQLGSQFAECSSRHTCNDSN